MCIMFLCKMKSVHKIKYSYQHSKYKELLHESRSRRNIITNQNIQLNTESHIKWGNVYLSSWGDIYWESWVSGMVSLMSVQVAELPTGSVEPRVCWNWGRMEMALFKKNLHLLATSDWLHAFLPIRFSSQRNNSTAS